MFRFFPGHVKDLGEDEGIFKGPWPQIFQNVEQSALSSLVGKIQGVVMLTMKDEDVSALQDRAPPRSFVLSIRDSKGLQFSHVLIIDFFKDLPHQRTWRKVLQGKEEAREEQGSPKSRNTSSTSSPRSLDAADGCTSLRRGLQRTQEKRSFDGWWTKKMPPSLRILIL